MPYSYVNKATCIRLLVQKTVHIEYLECFHAEALGSFRGLLHFLIRSTVLLAVGSSPPSVLSIDVQQVLENTHQVSYGGFATLCF